MKHKNEIMRWANSPEGTRVWIKQEDGIWSKPYVPTWKKDSTYIVDDEWAEIRKAFFDNKTIQFLNEEWEDSGVSDINVYQGESREFYRIKPDDQESCLFKLCEFAKEAEEAYIDSENISAPSGEWAEYNHDYLEKEAVWYAVEDIMDIIGSCGDCKLRYARNDGAISCEKDITSYGFPPKRPIDWYCADFEREKQ